jgi:cytochrome c553
MKKFLKWMGFVVAGLVVLAMSAALYAFFGSERALARQHVAARGPTLPLPGDATATAEGERLARLSGCQHCHGETMAGIFIVEIPNIARFYSPNVSRLQAEYSDDQLEAAIRDGVRRDGTSNWFMPSVMLHHLRDPDVAKVIAWVRTLPAQDGNSEVTKLLPLGRLLVAAGQLPPQAEQVIALPAETPVDDASPASRGRYLVMSFCSECHGQNLEGNELAHAPPLAVAKAYPLEDFTRLMHDGVGIGGRPLTLMRETAIARFSHFTPEEVRDIHSFLTGASAG